MNQEQPTDPLPKLRRLCLELPETTERISHGEPTWFERDKKVFVMYADHHHDDRVAFWCAAPGGAQEMLVAAHPQRFFVPPYVGHRGWLGVWLDVPLDWDEIADLVGEAYRMVAPKRLTAELDARKAKRGTEAPAPISVGLAAERVADRPHLRRAERPETRTPRTALKNRA